MCITNTNLNPNKIGHSSRSSSIQRSKTTEEVSGQGLVKGAELCLNPYFLAGWRSELAGCRSTLFMLKIKVKISETKYRSFYKTLETLNKYMMSKTSTTSKSIFLDCEIILSCTHIFQRFLKQIQGF